MRYSFIPLILAVASLTLTGCNTFERRAQKKADVFAALSPADQARLEKKVINVGDTADMVYIALGSPDEKTVATTASGETLTWTYNRYWQEYRGEAYGGFQRQVVRDPKTGATSVYLEPISRPVYAERQQPVMRIVFTDGKVSVIEQARQ
ncbi:MAG: hypothetical protein K0R17_1190 [Rariglobus sp.]|jgi:hypothetical protein|nr:hypothetical protein [Rariglobus sp.]